MCQIIYPNRKWMAWALTLALLVGMFPRATPTAASSMQFTVNRTDDPTPAVCNRLSCSLRGAIIAANANPGPDVIRLTHNITYSVITTVSGATDDATVGDLNITDNLTFDFADMACTSNCMATIQGSNALGNDRVFSIANGAQVQMPWLAIQGGYVIPSNPTGYLDGGGIYIAVGSTLTLTNSTVKNNRANNGGGIYNLGTLTLISTTVTLNVANSSQGGGIYSNQGGGTFQPGPLTIDHSAIITNVAQADGGGLFALRNATISHSTISHNKVITGSGAGLYVYSDPVTLTDVQIVSNTAQASTSIGGGIFDMNAPLILTDSTVGWNTAAYGGGLATYTAPTVQVVNSQLLNNTASAGDGGGILAVDFFATATYTLTGTTISGNKATGSGGGVYADKLALDGVTLSNNAADSDHNGSGSGGGLNKSNILLLPIANSFITGNSAASGGGFSANNVTLSHTVIRDNTATTGDGGGFYTGGTVTVSDTTIQSNTAVLGNGAGFWSAGGQITLSNTVIVSNTAQAATAVGGGIFNKNGQFQLTNSTLGWNSAGYGGGLAIYAGGDVRVVNSAVVNNIAGFEGGGIYDERFFATALFTLTNTTVNGNKANGSGGGLSILQVSLNNATLSNNTADNDHNGIGDGGGIFLRNIGQATIANSILAGNVAPGGQPSECAGGTLASLGYNLIQNATSCSITGVTTGNRTGVDPLLGPLQDNGGPTWTRALLKNSPAIDTGNPNPATCPPTDQRGVTRPVGGACDIGAYEWNTSGSRVYLPLIVR